MIIPSSAHTDLPQIKLFNVTPHRSLWWEPVLEFDLQKPWWSYVTIPKVNYTLHQIYVIIIYEEFSHFSRDWNFDHS